MSKRLQVILPDSEMREIQRVARRNRTTVAEWVRRVLRAARQGEPRTDSSRKLAVMDRHGVGTLLSFDSGFDGFPGVTRLH